MSHMSERDIERHNEEGEPMTRSNARRIRYAVFRTQRTARHWQTLSVYKSVPWYRRLFRRTR